MGHNTENREQNKFYEVIKNLLGLFKEFWLLLLLNSTVSILVTFLVQWLDKNKRTWSGSLKAMIEPDGLGLLFALNTFLTFIYVGYAILIKVRKERAELDEKMNGWDALVKVTMNKIPSECRLRLSTQLCNIRTVLENSTSETGIGGVDFIPEHIRHFQQIIDKCKPYSNEIVALDATNEIQWWNNSMIGYLALQSRLRLQKVLRIFVWPRERIISEKGRKLIVFHHYLGFETYILTPESYETLLNELLEEDKKGAVNGEFILFGGNMSKVEFKYRGYKSFWPACSTEIERKKLLETCGDLWFGNFTNEEEVNFCNKLANKIANGALIYSNIADLHNINDVVNGKRICAIKLQSEDVYDLKMGLKQFA